jgi:hypothetical protein
MDKNAEAEALEKLADTFGFAQFIVVGLIPGTQEEDGDEMHVLTSPMVSSYNALWLCIEAMQNLMFDLQDDGPSFH